MDSTKKTWDIGELIAINFLKKYNYQILDTNFKFGRFWEVDLIAKKDNLTIFVEVKYRNNTYFWEPEEAITKHKLRKCLRTVEYYCVRKHISLEKIRFDVITILKWEKSYKISHYRNVEL